MPGAPCFVLGAPNRFSGPTLISVTYYRKWICVRCRVMFSALGPGTDLNQAFWWKFWHFGVPERFSGFLGLQNGIPVRSGLLSTLHPEIKVHCDRPLTVFVGSWVPAVSHWLVCYCYWSHLLYTYYEIYERTGIFPQICIQQKGIWNIWQISNRVETF